MHEFNAQLNEEVDKACKKGDAMLIREFLRTNYAHSAANILHYSFVRSACKEGHLEVIKCFFDNPKIVNFIDSYDDIRNILKIAAQHNHLDIIQYLLPKAALKSTPQDDSAPSLVALMAASYGQIEPLQFIQENYPNDIIFNKILENGGLFEAAFEEGRINIIQYCLSQPLLKDKFNLESKGNTYFHVCYTNDQLEALRYLIFDLHLNETPEINILVNNTKRKVTETVKNWFKLVELNTTLTNELKNKLVELNTILTNELEKNIVPQNHSKKVKI